MFKVEPRHVLAGLTLLLSVALAQAPHAVLNAQASIVSIHALTPQGELKRGCSGGIVAGVIVTAAHCLTSAPGQTLVRTLDGELWPAHVLTINSDLDVATLHSIAVSKYPSLEVGGPLTLGDSVYAFSFPEMYGVLFLQGVYSGLLTGPRVPRPAYYVTMNSMSGASGSVILNARGEAVGVLSAVFRNNFSGVRLTGTVAVQLPESVQPH